MVATQGKIVVLSLKLVVVDVYECIMHDAVYEMQHTESTAVHTEKHTPMQHNGVML